MKSAAHVAVKSVSPTRLPLNLAIVVCHRPKRKVGLGCALFHLEPRGHMGLEIDFLPVGENSQSGDAILLRYGDLFGSREEQTVVLIDGGFSDTADAILDHLDKYYNTRTIDLVVSTHPDSDHINGLHELVARAAKGEVRIGELWMHRPSRWEPTIERALRKAEGSEYVEAVKRTVASAADLETDAERIGIPIHEPFTGLSFGSGELVVVGPTEEFYRSLFEEEAVAEASQSRLLRWLGAASEFVRSIAENWDIETLKDDGITSPINNSSAILRFTWEEGVYLFTADAGIPALELAADILEANGFTPEQLRFIQVPHHGSRRNVGPTVLNRLLGLRRSVDQPVRTAFVSAAKKGAPKHPAKKVTNAFRRRATKVHATQGTAKCHHRDAPSRGWSTSEPLPFYTTVEE